MGFRGNGLINEKAMENMVAVFCVSWRCIDGDGVGDQDGAMSGASECGGAAQS